MHEKTGLLKILLCLAFLLFGLLKQVNIAVESKTIGSLSNHDERDDDVKYARRDWDENVAFGRKMKLKQ